MILYFLYSIFELWRGSNVFKVFLLKKMPSALEKKDLSTTRDILPNLVTPLHYDLELSPNLADFKCPGKVWIRSYIYQRI